MANLTSEDVRKLIEASSWEHPYSGHGNDFTLPVLNPAFTDLGIRWAVFIKLIDAEGDKTQRLVISSSTDSVPDGLRQEAYEFCNKWANECSYVRTWFNEEDGKVYIGASVENPGDLPEKWLVDSFVNQSLEIIEKFWAESFLKLTELDKLKASQKARAEAAPKSGVVALDEVRKAAEQGNAEAQVKLGEMYRQGVGVTQDLAETVKWYRKAAEQGHVVAQCNLGVCYAKGDGVEEDIEEAMKWFRKAADQGNAVAEKYYQRCLSLVAQRKTTADAVQAKVTSKSEAESPEEVRKAAEQGNAEAQFKLGEMYRQGVGVTQDFAETAKWYRKAAEQGHVAAQCNLGVCYAKGDGVEEDIDEAMKWFRKAADQGDTDARNYYCMLEVRQFKKMMSGAKSSKGSQLNNEDTVLAEKTSWKVKVGWACVAALILLLIVVRIIIKS